MPVTDTAINLTEAFAAQHAASRNDPVAPWETRSARLKQLLTLMKANRADLAAAISDDFGNRSPSETELIEFFPAIGALRHALAHGKRWMRPRRRRTTLWFRPGRSRLLPQPKGVAGIIVPWNYPLLLTVAPLASALAAGNRVMIKLSEFTPRFSDLFARLAGEAFAADELFVVNGDADVARAFSALPFDHLLFTGSTAVGRHVMRAASDNLTPVTLELGGKSPAIVGPGADFDHAVARIVLGKLVNAGQTCIAPDYVLLPKGKIEEFAERAATATRRFYPGLAANTDFATIINQKQFDRLTAWQDEARAAGAHIIPLGDGSNDPARRLFVPAAITGAPDNTSVMREEIFGPLLPLVEYDTVDDAIAYVNARPRPLALYVFDRDEATVSRVLARTSAGGVTVNDTLLHIAQDDLPFGGIGPSGMGAYHGEEGFLTFSHMKPVFIQTRLNAAGLLAPPFGRMRRALIRILLR
jgi:aldehyde dehydrogenase (NAD+)/coniferyl-aldehyde dehydrogenase